MAVDLPKCSAGSQQQEAAGLGHRVPYARETLGGLKPAVRDLLERVSENPTGSRVAFNRAVTKASAGTVLIRDWRGQSHHVTVLEHGVLYRKQNYRSYYRKLWIDDVMKKAAYPSA